MMALLSTIVAQGNIGSNVGGTEAKTYSVTANGTSSYFLMAKGHLIIQTLPSKGEVPTLLICLLQDTFFINTIKVRELQNASGANNGAVSGRITFTVPMHQAHYYNCQFHGSMNGTITITN
jgi:hypothetical protein